RAEWLPPPRLRDTFPLLRRSRPQDGGRRPGRGPRDADRSHGTRDDTLGRRDRPSRHRRARRGVRRMTVAAPLRAALSARGASARTPLGLPEQVRGFSLLEAMVALVVLSVGMLGIAALHGQSLAASRTAQLRTQAVNLAGDMADRIRVNRLGAAAYAGAA